ncbi:hypothetical protein THEYE_A2026 [Thermodesulfovibrio yellowstonii DSM 11347]|uniref:Uncharacterized protein n=1 Tax=Thermodesulfovibrio yellowstonii (strain ATCC 51303 / DSM 11347 / YP87) TaxID=289376 RepID=B5YIT9_THEYD|nr:hypothetical protein THEYE_A2026 [Thermodesulfovibrio yellowstonii DSM 11347]
MVQMKLFASIYAVYIIFKLYIPHGSDETFSYSKRKALSGSPSLYIPHGSDETILYFANSVFYVCFISHMVQMKRIHEKMPES